MKIVDDMASHDSTRTLKKGQKQQRMELKKTHIGKELPSSYFFAIVQVERKKGSGVRFYVKLKRPELEKTH